MFDKLPYPTRDLTSADLTLSAVTDTLQQSVHGLALIPEVTVHVTKRRSMHKVLLCVLRIVHLRENDMCR